MPSISHVVRRRVASMLALLALVPGLVTAAGLSASLDRTRVAEGETVVLTLAAPGDATGMPDPAPLEKDFDLLSQSQGSRTSIVNGRSSSTREWQWVLAPKHTGKLQIPALTMGASTSAPLALEVVPATQAASLGEARPVLLEVEAEPRQPYVQGQVIYSVKLLARVPLYQASLSEPEAGDAIVERLGEDKQYSTYRNGQQYQVTERRYALFPQHSGKLEIAPPVLSAQLPDQGRRRGSLRERFFGGDPFADMNRFFGSDPFADLDGIFEQTRPLQLRGRPIDLEVQSQPAGAASPWLPAESLRLDESWSPDPPVLRVGEPVTRTLAITAQGLSAAQLPDLQPRAPDGIKVYPDQAQSETRADGDTLVAQKVLKSALVPSQAGELTLPEVRLSWWDTRTGKAAVARLPARTVQVLPAAAGTSVSPPAVAQQAPRPEPLAEAGPSAPAAGQADVGKGLSGIDRLPTREAGPPAGYWPWIAGGLALAWLGSTLLWLRARAARPGAIAAPTQSVQPRPEPVKSLDALKKACTAGDPRAARQALLAWASACWPENPPGGLETLARRLDGDAAQVLRELDRFLYASEGPPWDGASAWPRLAPALNKEMPKTARSGGDSPLPPLYPQSA